MIEVPGLRLFVLLLLEGGGGQKEHLKSSFDPTGRSLATLIIDFSGTPFYTTRSPKQGSNKA